MTTIGIPIHAIRALQALGLELAPADDGGRTVFRGSASVPPDLLAACRPHSQAIRDLMIWSASPLDDYPEPDAPSSTICDYLHRASDALEAWDSPRIEESEKRNAGDYANELRQARKRYMIALRLYECAVDRERCSVKAEAA